MVIAGAAGVGEPCACGCGDLLGGGKLGGGMAGDQLGGGMLRGGMAGGQLSGGMLGGGMAVPQTEGLPSLPVDPHVRAHVPVDPDGRAHGASL